LIFSAIVQNEKKGKNDFIPGRGIQGPFGCIDKAGKELIPLEWDVITPISDNLLLCQKNKKYGLISSSGSIIVMHSKTALASYTRIQTKPDLLIKPANISWKPNGITPDILKMVLL
jgi:hypothetical protein